MREPDDPLPSSLSSRFSIAPSRFSSFSSPRTLRCSSSTRFGNAPNAASTLSTPLRSAGSLPRLLRLAVPRCSSLYAWPCPYRASCDGGASCLRSPRERSRRCPRAPRMHRRLGRRGETLTRDAQGDDAESVSGGEPRRDRPGEVDPRGLPGGREGLGRRPGQRLSDPRAGDRKGDRERTSPTSWASRSCRSTEHRPRPTSP